jgi:hypothetical protein
MNTWPRNAWRSTQRASISKWNTKNCILSFFLSNFVHDFVVRIDPTTVYSIAADKIHHIVEDVSKDVYVI